MAQRKKIVSKSSRQRPFGQKFLISLGCVLTVVALVAASSAAFTLRQSRKLVRDELGLPGSPPGEPANWLLVGTDSRDGISIDDPNYNAFLKNGVGVVGKRTDTLMIARVNPQTQTIDLVSVPRDLWVNIDGKAGRVNSVYQVDNPNNSAQENQSQGRSKLVETIQNNLGVNINHYAEVDFIGFQEIVDSLGGVKINFENPARDRKSGFNVVAGEQLLDGSQSLAYARSRFYEEQLENGKWKIDPTSDLGRTARQRNFIVQVMKTFAGEAASVNVIDTDKQISVIADNIVFSNSVDYSSLIDLVQTYRTVGETGISSHSLPVTGDRVNGASILRIQAEEADLVLAKFR